MTSRKSKARANGATAPTRQTRKRRANGERTYQNLLAAAVSLMAEGGAQAVTLVEAARRAGVSRNTAYHHFHNRDRLLEAAMRDIDHQLEKIVDGSRTYENPYGIVAGLTIENESLMRSRIFEILDQGVNHPYVRVLRERFRVFAATGRLQPGVDPDIAALIGVGHHLAAVLAIQLARSPEEKRDVARRFADTDRHAQFYGLVDPGSDSGWPMGARPADPPDGR